MKGSPLSKQNKHVSKKKAKYLLKSKTNIQVQEALITLPV